MAAKDDVLKKLTSLKGIGKVKADSIIEAGFDSESKIQKASIEDLCTVNGVSESVAQMIKDEFGKKTAEKTASKTPEKKSEKASEVKPKEKKETKQAPKKETSAVKEKPEKKVKKSTDHPDDYTVKIKPELSKEKHKYLKIRKEKKDKTPHFLRQEWFRYKRIPKNWHRPDGITSKMRMNKKYRSPLAHIGYRGPKKVRGLHPSGFEEVLVHNVSDLEKIDVKTQAARIGSTVGTKKRVAITEKAKELEIRLLNK